MNKKISETISGTMMSTMLLNPISILGSTNNCEDTITNFFTKLSADQEPLGNDFEEVLLDNLWDMNQD